jgi:phosphoserine phosphatase RsbU/P
MWTQERRCVLVLENESRTWQAETIVRRQASAAPTRTVPPEWEDKLRGIQSVTDRALSELDSETFLDVLVERVREALQADTAAILLLDKPSGHLIATAASGLEEEVRQGVRIPIGRGFAGRIAAQGAPVLLDQVDDTKVINPILLAKGISSLMGAPLLASGTVIGVLHVGTLIPRKFTEEDVDLLQLAADRAVVAVQSLQAQLDRAAASALQRSLLPSALPTVPGLSMAARYVPGSGNIGGDWYDVFQLPSGAVCAVIGDVAGSGLRAAAIMGRVRSALRAYALETDDPAEILTRLDRKMRYFEPDAMVTLLCAVFSLSLDRVSVASAGHLPPVVARVGHAASPAAIVSDLLIGVPDARARHVSGIDFPAGATLCLYTDGLVERRDRPIDEGISRLCAALPVGDPEVACACVMAAMTDASPRNDDVALLIISRERPDNEENNENDENSAFPPGGAV